MIGPNLASNAFWLFFWLLTQNIIKLHLIHRGGHRQNSAVLLSAPCIQNSIMEILYIF